MKITSEKSLQAIARETEQLAGEVNNDGRMVRGDMKISLQEIQEFMSQISPYKATKITRKELREYLSAFPQKQIPGKDPAEQKVKKSDINFLMSGKQEMEAEELYELLSKTQIEDFDAVEEAFKLLDVENAGFLTVDTFKSIFEKLRLGTIDPADEEIFREVADNDKDGQISLEDFRAILEYKPSDEDNDPFAGLNNPQQPAIAGDQDQINEGDHEYGDEDDQQHDGGHY